MLTSLVLVVEAMAGEVEVIAGEVDEIVDVAADVDAMVDVAVDETVTVVEEDEMVEEVLVEVVV